MAHPFKVQRTSSLVSGEAAERSSDAGVTDSPYAMRVPIRASAGVQPSYTGGHAAIANAGKGGGGLTTTPEIIRPSPGNPSRQSEPQTAMFNLLATIVGGGVLSIPYAIRKLGLVVGILVLAMAAIAGDFSLYMLCSCSRRTGKITYIQIGRAAFGATGAFVATALLLILTVFVMIGYMVLVRDIWGGNVAVLVGDELDMTQSNQVLFAAVLVVFPVCLFKDLRALRHLCYMGFFSVIILTTAIAYHSIKANKEKPAPASLVKLSPDSLADVLDALPIFSLAFMAQFNILSVHSQFVNPTRERLKGLLHGTMGLAASLYLIMGMCGYLYAFEDTKDDILLNYDPADKVMLLGRLGVGINVLVSIAMLVLPCREILIEVGMTAATSLQGFFGNKDYIPVHDVPITPGGSPMTGTVVGAVSSCVKVVRHVGITLALFAVGLFFALVVPGVSLVWSVCGSSVGFMIAYWLPALFYLRIRWHKPFNVRKAGALLMLVSTSVAIVVCTHHSAMKVIGA